MTYGQRLYPFGKPKICPTCQYEEMRLDAPYCSYCGGKHTEMVIIIKEVSIPVVLDETMPVDMFRLVSRKRYP